MRSEPARTRGRGSPAPERRPSPTCAVGGRDVALQTLEEPRLRERPEGLRAALLRLPALRSSPSEGAASLPAGDPPTLAVMPLGLSGVSIRSDGSEVFLEDLDWELSRLQRQCKVMEAERQTYSKEVQRRTQKQL
ncbi:Coiled-coil domain-containing protein 114 [Fukomys damarensis]|uniref:Coiled-coil domain-containing protein 114 n=1 Tax=Fukomys damarensis TaxID=885580 RepID=A0A091D7P6_FUKDA|nr:Coiled-coil domain-containing protein 114 [Fukomys damarensis]